MRARDPRTLILATYDVFGERAGELGWGRSPGETPEEFRRRLSTAAVLADTDDPRLARLTSTVVRAAYAPTQPDERAASEARRRRRCRVARAAGGGAVAPATARAVPAHVRAQEPVAVSAAASRSARTNLSRSSWKERTLESTEVAMSSIATKNAI